MKGSIFLSHKKGDQLVRRVPPFIAIAPESFQKNAPLYRISHVTEHVLQRNVLQPGVVVEEGRMIPAAARESWMYFSTFFTRLGV